MKSNLLEELKTIFACPDTKAPLALSGDQLIAADGRSFPVVRNIPRFVDSDMYVSSFSFEWNTHNTTQLDSCTGDNASENYLIQKTGLRPEDVKGKLVLDAGVGAGRYAEVLARWGAKVVGCDLSFAVEASYKNTEHLPNCVVAQADIGRLPFQAATFDLIISIGVLHHTPDTKKYFQALVPLLKPGGTICIWVYPDFGEYRKRSYWTPFTSRIPSTMFYSWCRWFVPKALANLDNGLIKWINDVFPFSYEKHGMENAILDTFDSYSPRYHGVHSPEEVEGWFHESGLSEVRQPGDFPTSVRGMKPAAAVRAPATMSLS